MISRCSFDFYTVLYMMEVSGEFPPVQPPMHRLHLNGFVSRVILRVRDSVASRRGSRMLDIRGMRLFRFRGPGRCILDGSVPTLKRCPDIARHPCRNVSTMQRSSSLSRTLPSCPGISWSVDWHDDGVVMMPKRIGGGDLPQSQSQSLIISVCVRSRPLAKASIGIEGASSTERTRTHSSSLRTRTSHLRLTPAPQKKKETAPQPQPLHIS